MILRYFNVAGADPSCAPGNRRVGATHLIKVAVETALGMRPQIDVYGTDYETPDGTCIRDYIHVTDLGARTWRALAHLRRGGASGTFNCGYGHGYSVLEVVDAVKRVSGRDFTVRAGAAPARRSGSDRCGPRRIRAQLGWTPRFDDLDTIVAHALAWERRLENLRDGVGAASGR